MSYEEDLSVFEEPEEDFCTLMLGDQKPREPNAVAWEKYFGQCVWASPESLVALDIETDFDWEKKTGGDNVTVMAACVDGRTYVAEGPTLIMGLLAQIQHSCIIGHNSFAFDIPRLQALAKINEPIILG
jgi:hypothetical protein